jgi:hypothetical protein
LYSTFGFIFDDLERETPGFYMLNRAKQWTLLEAKVISLIPEKKAPILFKPPAVEPIEEPVE